MMLGEPSGRSRVVRGDVHMARAVPLMGAQPNRIPTSEDPRENAPYRDPRGRLGLRPSGPNGPARGHEHA